jgi:asparagine synthase (glutamine-hydrolysing)
MSRAATAEELRIAVNGRLHDRNELLARLSLSWQASDAEIVAAAYRRWDAAFPEHIEGEFSVALWDERNERLLLVRDAFGLRPLYLHQTPDTVTWSSHVKALADEVDCDRTPDPHFVAGFLTYGRRGDVSPFAAIQGIPPASIFIDDRGGRSIRTYWRVDPEREIRLRSDEEYEEQFFALFKRSVGNRMPAGGTLFCELSGGVDSSSVFAIADAIHREQGRSPEHLQSVSHIYEETGAADDRPFIDIIERAFAHPAHHAEERLNPLFTSAGEEYPFDEPTPLWAGAEFYADIDARMAAENSSVILSGMGGDDVTWSEVGTPPSVADALSRFRLVRAFGESRRWAPALRKPQIRILLDGLRAVRNPTELVPPPWIDPRFARATGIDDPWRHDAELRAIRLPSRRAQFAGLRCLAVESGLRRNLEPRIDVRYPFLDRRLIEFVFGVPIEQHLRPGETRSLQRRAMARVLPREIAQRRTKGGPGGTIYRRFRQRWPVIKTLFAKPHVVEYGFVDRAALDDALTRAAHGVNLSAPGLLRLIALESWLRTLERPSVAVDPRDTTRSSTTGRR